MKHIKLYEDFVNEATTSWKKMMQGVRSSETGPWSIVAIENKKVVGQKIDIKIQDMIPAHYEAMRKEFPRAKIHIEDGTGMVVWNESLEVNEGGGTLKVEKEKDGKYYWTFTFKSGKVEKWPNGFATSAEAQKDFMYRSKYLKESLELDENFPGPGETVDAKDLDYDMLDYFSRTNKVLLIDTKSKKGIKGGVGKMHGDLVFNGDDIKLKDIVSVKILEGTFNNNREIAIYDGEDGLTYIEKRGKGYYGWNDEFDFEATDKADLEKKLKSWKYKLVSGSIDENIVEIDEAIKIVPGMGAFYKYTQDHKVIEKIFKEAFKGQEDKLYRANFFNTGASCIKFELKNQSSWQLVYYPGQTYLEDHSLGSISLYPYGPQEERYRVFRVGVKGNRMFGDTKMTPAEIKEAAAEFKKWVNNK